MKLLSRCQDVADVRHLKQKIESLQPLFNIVRTITVCLRVSNFTTLFNKYALHRTSYKR